MKRILILLSITATIGWAQLQPGQKVQDLQNLASLFAKEYAPGNWKVKAFNYNFLDMGPWVDKIQATTDDLGFYEVLAEYVAALNDAHSVYFNPSDFLADLHFTTDIYGGKVLIDSIDRTQLSATKYPFQVGDEIVTVDNRTPADYIQDFSRFRSLANPLSTSRHAAGYIPVRLQYIDPRAEQLGATATVVIKRQSGKQETYVIPWDKSGTPLSVVGPSPFPQVAAKVHKHVASTGSTKTSLDPRQPFRRMKLPDNPFVLGYDDLAPVFKLPQGFLQRLGNGFADEFFTGTYKSGTKTIGYIRIPDFDPFFVDGAEQDFDTEIAYMQQSTDGLVIDVMRNPGGDGCYAEDLVSRLVTKPFHDVVFELRPVYGDVIAFQEFVQELQGSTTPTWQIQVYQQLSRLITQAYQKGGLTVPIPACSYGSTRAPNKDSKGKLAVYTKPILLLTDGFSASAAELFASMFQDAKRGKNFGTRTMGAGGSVQDGNPVGYYSEGVSSVTVSLLVRQNPVVTTDYPTAPLVENIGVRPEVENEYMTLSNLLNGGKDFVTAFTKEIVSMIGN